MTWNDQRPQEPAQPSWEPAPSAWDPAQPAPAEPAPTPSGQPAAFGGVRRTIATAALAIGLLVVGGTAVVLAADPSASPDPSATTAPNATTAPSAGTTQPRTHTPGSTKDCPNMGGSGSGGSGGSGGSTAPSTTGPTSSPEL